MSWRWSQFSGRELSVLAIALGADRLAIQRRLRLEIDAERAKRREARAKLADWFGSEEEVPEMCEVCGEHATVDVARGDESLTLCHVCMKRPAPDGAIDPDLRNIIARVLGGGRSFVSSMPFQPLEAMPDQFRWKLTEPLADLQRWLDLHPEP